MLVENLDVVQITLAPMASRPSELRRMALYPVHCGPFRSTVARSRETNGMATAQRIENLKTYCAQWKESLESVTRRRDELLQWQSSGLHIYENDSRQDLLPTMINEADAAAKNLHAILVRMEALRDRAVAGEDV
jgi:hypothetical protein